MHLYRFESVRGTRSVKAVARKSEKNVKNMFSIQLLKFSDLLLYNQTQYFVDLIKLKSYNFNF